MTPAPLAPLEVLRATARGPYAVSTLCPVWVHPMTTQRLASTSTRALMRLLAIDAQVDVIRRGRVR